MPVEVPQRSKRTRPVLISLGLITASAVGTLTLLPESKLAPKPQIVGAVALQPAGPSSAAARVPDALVIPAKKKAKKKKAPVTPAATGPSSAVQPATSSPATVRQPSTGASAPVRSATTRTAKPSGSSGSSASAAEAEFGPG